MTAAVAHRRQAAPAGRRSPSRPKLEVLDRDAIRRRARRRNAMLMLFIIVLSGLFLVAFVHAGLVASQQDLDQIRSEIAELEAEKARIERAVDEASSPATIVERAEDDLGMVRAQSPLYLVAVRGTGSGPSTVGDAAAG